MRIAENYLKQFSFGEDVSFSKKTITSHDPAGSGLKKGVIGVHSTTKNSFLPPAQPIGGSDSSRLANAGPISTPVNVSAPTTPTATGAPIVAQSLGPVLGPTQGTPSGPVLGPTLGGTDLFA